MVIFRAHGDVAIAVKERQFAVQALLNSSGLFQHRNQEQDLYAEHWPQRGFYAGMDQYVDKTFAANQTNFKNAYTIFDLLNVASIHNASIPLPDNADMFQLRTLADQHEFGLAYNASEPIRAVTGSIIAAQVPELQNPEPMSTPYYIFKQHKLPDRLSALRQLSNGQRLTGVWLECLFIK